MDYRGRAPIYQNSEDLLRLQLAVQRGRLREVRMLVSSSAKPFVEYESGRVLRSALRLGHAGVARYLIQQGFSVNVEIYEYRETPLHVAISLGLSDIVAMLLDRQADVNARNPCRETPLHRAVTARYFQENDQLHVIQSILDRGASVNARNLHRTTPLHEACKRNLLAVVTTLVAGGASIHSKTSSKVMPPWNPRRLFSPLYFAVKSGSVEIVDYLVREGAPVLIEDKVSPLHLAIRQANIPMIQALTGTRMEYLPVLLNEAILSERQHVVEYILRKGAEVNPTENLHPLHVAAATGKGALCEFLLQNGAYIDAKQTLSDVQVREHLRLLGCLKIDVSSLDLFGLGQTALHFAVKNSQDAVVKLLLRNGANVNCRDELEKTALHLQHRRMDSVSRLTASRLLNYGTDVNIVDRRGQRVFHLGYLQMCASVFTSSLRGSMEWQKMFVLFQRGVIHFLKKCTPDLDLVGLARIRSDLPGLSRIKPD